MAKRESSPAYLWYPKDVLSSGRISELSAAEECWYRRALDRSWLDDGVPADPAKCAAQIGKNCTVKAAEKILQMFFDSKKNDTSKMVNDRQEKERKLLNQKRKQKSEAGKRGMAKRWEQKSKGDNTVITENNIPIAIPIPISLSNKKQSGDDFIHDLKTNPDYSHIQVDIELSRAEAWARDKGRQFTRRFVTAWFDRVEAPLKISTNGNGSKPPPQWKIDQDACEACDENGYVLNLIPHKVCKHQ